MRRLHLAIRSSVQSKLAARAVRASSPHTPVRTSEHGAEPGASAPTTSPTTPQASVGPAQLPPQHPAPRPPPCRAVSFLDLHTPLRLRVQSNSRARTPCLMIPTPPHAKQATGRCSIYSKLRGAGPGTTPAFSQVPGRQLPPAATWAQPVSLLKAPIL